MRTPGWPDAPVAYEIDTWPWLTAVAARLGRPVTLADVPAEVWDETIPPGVDAVWLMGVWERSPAGLAIARADEGLQRSFRAALPDLTPDDVVGSPYCVHRYVVDERLGGPAGLAAARADLRRRGVRLILDFVPNHVAPDHPAVAEHPEWFIQGDAADLARDPGAWFAAGERVVAHGRDPYFAPWPDVAQLNAFDPGLRDVTAMTLAAIAAQCDGIRCDMAMLFTTEVFARTWGAYAGLPLADEFWPDVIARVRRDQPDVLLIAEAYWDTEWALQQQGFDLCYDKRLYDRLAHEDAESVLHITDVPYGTKPTVGSYCTDANVNNALAIVAGMTTELADRVTSVKATETASTTLTIKDGPDIVFGTADNIREKERVCLQIMKEHPEGVTYINVRTPDRPTWRSL